jgi:hypothetical protein
MIKDNESYLHVLASHPRKADVRYKKKILDAFIREIDLVDGYRGSFVDLTGGAGIVTDHIFEYHHFKTIFLNDASTECTAYLLQKYKDVQTITVSNKDFADCVFSEAIDLCLLDMNTFTLKDSATLRKIADFLKMNQIQYFALTDVASFWYRFGKDGTSVYQAATWNDYVSRVRTLFRALGYDLAMNLKYGNNKVSLFLFRRRS